MTQPIQEPTLQRKDTALTWGQNQLYRRPAPVAEAETPLAEWTTSNSTTNVNGWTTLDWGSLNTNGFDTDLPTFSRTAGNDFQIHKGGLFSMDFAFGSFVLDPNVTTVLELEFTSIATTDTYSIQGNMDTNPIVPVIPLRVDSVDSDVDFSNLPDPCCSFHFMVSQVDVDNFGPAVMEILANVTEDGAPVSHTAQTFHLLVTRHGAVWEN